MATSTSSKKTTATRKKQTYKKKAAVPQRRNNKKTEQEHAINNEVLLIVLLAIDILLFLCNFGIIGKVGDFISNIQIGLFGIMGYLAPLMFFMSVSFAIVNHGNRIAINKLIASICLFFIIGAFFHIFGGKLSQMESYSISSLYEVSVNSVISGGVFSGTIAFLLYSLLDLVGTVLVLFVFMLICIIIITQKSFIRGVKHNGRKVYDSAKEDVSYRREQLGQHREQQQILRDEKIKQKHKREQERGISDKKVRRMDKIVTGVMLEPLQPEVKPISIVKQDIHEIFAPTDMELGAVDACESITPVVGESVNQSNHDFDFNQIKIHKAKVPELDETPLQEEVTRKMVKEPTSSKSELVEKSPHKMESEIKKSEGNLTKKYSFPPINCLKKMKNTTGDSTVLLKETALRLQQTLQTFGVKVVITDISQGPAVTRYELQPESGVKVSKIVGLADDIKLNLAATDIRIEAPIPGKAAVGIEVPNKENTSVGLRELLEHATFKNHPSKIAFAVGKDISGNVVVSDIAKMPHMLIAGATGSGKSVCINTIIMSILYKAHPEDVKLIMIDPKVVELSVYNGIPHLLVPVVTDCKKAAAALHWGVAEMTDRYQKFADCNVRDLVGYNKYVEKLMEKGEETILAKMPQIVIIVDELADLMMVAPGEVEEAICRLAQLARAAGIHLIIATQRPSVDVITGLIKANMPSRVAFSVSSGVDSRTILDMNGAEKLLGKGDMLFYPQGYPKPMRMQCAFVSDAEVFDVVDFLKNQAIGNIYDEKIEEKIKTIGVSNKSTTTDGGNGTERDTYFVEAAQFIIEKEKASIGMLQRVFKIGFNRAARIMDQLSEAGVVGEEEGTKPRKVLMSMEQFESYIEEDL